MITYVTVDTNNECPNDKWIYKFISISNRIVHKPNQKCKWYKTENMMKYEIAYVETHFFIIFGHNVTIVIKKLC